MIGLEQLTSQFDNLLGFRVPQHHCSISVGQSAPGSYITVLLETEGKQGPCVSLLNVFNDISNVILFRPPNLCIMKLNNICR